MIYCPGYRIGVAHGMLGLVLLQYFCLFGDCLTAGSNSRESSLEVLTPTLIERGMARGLKAECRSGSRPPGVR